MAENSLFAILLRSRWWVSFTVGAGWALLAAALVPQPYKMVAILGSLPFWALGFVAFVRQYDQPTPAQQRALLESAAQQNWNEFAQHLERAWATEGYSVARSKDAAADFVLQLTARIVAENQLTTMMVTHSMRQALDVGQRTVMLHQGQVVLDVSGEERQRMDVPDLLQMFEKVRGEKLADDALLLG